MAAEIVINLSDAIYALLFEGGSYDWTKLVDPWGLFGIAGRPHDQATEEVINRLESSPNPAARLWGIELARGLSQFDLVISTSGSGRTILNAWYSQFVANMAAQGVSKTRAQEIGLNAMSTAAQAGAPLEPELQQPLASGLTFNGPQAISDTFLQGIKIWNQQGFVGPALIQKAENYTLKNSTVAHLTALRLGQPAPGPKTLPIPTEGGTGLRRTETCQPGYAYDAPTQLCFPVPPAQQPIPTCPPGQHWDPLQFKCVPDTTPVTPPPPPGGNNGPDPDGDEITNTLCAQMNAAADRIVAAIGTPAGGSGAPIDFTPVINAIEDVVNVLTAISTTLPTLGGSSGAPVDLTGVITALDALVSAVGAIPPAGAVDLTPIVNAINAIALKIPPAGGTDVSGIVDQLRQMVVQGDVDQTIFDTLQQQGLISPADLQVLQGLKWSDALAYLTGSTPVRTVENFIKDVGADVDSAKAYIGSGTGPGADWLIRQFGGSIKTAANALEPTIARVIEGIVRELKPTNLPTVGQVNVDADKVVADVASTMLNMKVLAAVVSLLREGAGEELDHISEKITALLGFEELREVQIGPLVREGIARQAEMNARALFAQEIPGSSTIASWVTRGLFDRGKAAQWMLYNGTGPEAFGPTLNAAYSGLNARQMLRLAGTGLFSQGDITDELTFSGMRPASQKRMLLAAQWLATNPQRNQLRASLEKAYINGLLGDADLQQQLDELDQNVDRDALVMARVQLEKRIAFAKELENSYTVQFRANVINGAQLQSFLAGLGLQQDFINNRIALEEAKSISADALRVAAEARALERATLAEERRAAVRNFKQGNIDQVALGAALALTGLSPAQLAAWVDLAVLEKAGSLRWIFGQQLPPAQASLLRARVTALADQRKRQELTDPAFVAALTALNIPPNFINSIRAAADALVSPKTAAVTIPVETG